MILIQLYKDNKSKFDSTTIKNHKVWLIITSQIENRSLDQCRNRFKYLKGKYIKVKDSMGPKGTGKKKKNFVYFEALDEIFRSEPNVVPTAVSDSTDPIDNFPAMNPDAEKGTTDAETERYFTHSEDEREYLETQEDKKKKKIKKRKVDLFNENLWVKNRVEKEFHSQKLEVQKHAVSALQKIADAFETLVKQKSSVHEHYEKKTPE